MAARLQRSLVRCARGGYVLDRSLGGAAQLRCVAQLLERFDTRRWRKFDPLSLAHRVH